MNKKTEKDASIKLARKRLNVIEMAEVGWTAPVSMSGKGVSKHMGFKD